MSFWVWLNHVLFCSSYFCNFPPFILCFHHLFWVSTDYFQFPPFIFIVLDVGPLFFMFLDVSWVVLHVLYRLYSFIIHLISLVLFVFKFCCLHDPHHSPPKIFMFCHQLSIIARGNMSFPQGRSKLIPILYRKIILEPKVFD